ncbi:MAG: GGDEF domain-containing protein [Nitrospinae bacterium]|nr:GGDEF domain-containing protein [Nitrospinota bacterium]
MDQIETNLERAAETARKAIPFMAERKIPVTPKNYFVWYEYFLGENLPLKAAVDEALASGAVIDDMLCARIYDKFALRPVSEFDSKKIEAEMRALDAASAATKKLLDPIAENLKNLSSSNLNFGEKMAGIATKMEKQVESEQVEELVRVIMEDTKKIATENKSISVQLTTYSGQVNDLRQMLARAKAEARMDDLTQVGNRRAFNESLGEEAKWVVRNNSVSCVAMVDIDFFKKINDKYGHAIGDKALVAIARQLMETTSMVAEVFRYGGEEFAVIISGAKIEQGLELMEKGRKSVFEQEFVIRDKTEEITISIGVALISPDRSAEESVKLADDALYLAKKSGRNNVKSELDLKKK